jgi:hypothetical protein
MYSSFPNLTPCKRVGLQQQWLCNLAKLARDFLILLNPQFDGLALPNENSDFVFLAPGFVESLDRRLASE